MDAKRNSSLKKHSFSSFVIIYSIVLTILVSLVLGMVWSKSSYDFYGGVLSLLEERAVDLQKRYLKEKSADLSFLINHQLKKYQEAVTLDAQKIIEPIIAKMLEGGEGSIKAVQTMLSQSRFDERQDLIFIFDEQSKVLFKKGNDAGKIDLSKIIVKSDKNKNGNSVSTVLYQERVFLCSKVNGVGAIALSIQNSTMLQQLKSEALQYTAKLRFSRQGGINILDDQGKLLVYNGEYFPAGLNVELVDSEGADLRSMYVERSTLSGNQFMQYQLVNKLTGEIQNKLAYVDAFPQWGWIKVAEIGAQRGFVNENVEQIAVLRSELWRDLVEATFLVVFVVLISFGSSWLITRVFSKNSLTLMQFFKEANVESVHLDPDKVSFREFSELVDAANMMVETRKSLEDNLQNAYSEANEARMELTRTNVQLEDSIKRANELALQSEIDNIAKSNFLASMSHEIRTSMNAIIGFAEILGAKVRSPQNHHYLTMISSSSKSLLKLIDDILDLSKVEAGRMELEKQSVDVKAVVKDVVDSCEQVAGEKSLDIQFEYCQDFPQELLLDEARFRQVVHNLVSNAVQFTNEEGSITIKVDKDGDYYESKQIGMTLSVADNGMGIPKKYQSKVFDPFSQIPTQGNETGKGAGLGLALTKKVVELMGGEISFTTKLKKGTTFTIRLPEVPVVESKQVDAESLDDLSNIKFGPAKVLIVDDIPINLVLLKEFLSDQPFEIIEGVNGKEAVQKAKEDKPDIILMDMKMPVMDGYTATARIKGDDDLSSIPIIAVTASVMKDNLEEIDRLCDGCVGKPVSQETLYKVLVNYLPISKS